MLLRAKGPLQSPLLCPSGSLSYSTVSLGPGASLADGMATLHLPESCALWCHISFLQPEASRGPEESCPLPWAEGQSVSSSASGSGGCEGAVGACAQGAPTCLAGNARGTLIGKRWPLCPGATPGVFQSPHPYSQLAFSHTFNSPVSCAQAKCTGSFGCSHRTVCLAPRKPTEVTVVC